jgi:AAA domain
MTTEHDADSGAPGGADAVGVSALHAGCRDDLASCPDPLTCDVFPSLEDAIEYERLQREAEKAAWEAERILYEDEARRLHAQVQAEEQRKLTSWAPLDLAGVLDGSLKPPQTVHFARTDGVCLLYPKRTHSFIGESEHCKTIGAYCACAQVLLAGGGVVYVDFEGELEDFARWMVQLGVPTETIAQRARFIRPDEPFGSPVSKLALWGACVEVQPSLVVLDGVTEAMMLHDLDDNRGTDTARFMNMLPRQFEQGGGSVILIDHVPHGAARATGSQHKRSAVTGASYLFVRTAPLIEGQHGKVDITVLKDRPSQVRKNSAGGKQVGTMHVRLADDLEGTAVYVEPPPGFLATLGHGAPPAAMERVSRHVEANPGCSRTDASKGAGGDREDNELALDALAMSGHLSVVERHHGTQLRRNYSSIKPFRS